VTTVTHAAEITWQPPAAVTQAADILNPIGSTVHIAADFNNANGFASGDDDTINGIPFVLTPSAGSGNLITNMTNGPAYGTTFFPALLTMAILTDSSTPILTPPQTRQQ